VKLNAEFFFEAENAKDIYSSVLPELDENYSERSVIELELRDSEHLVLSVRAEDVVSMRSALNTWFRLFQIAQEVAQAAGSTVDGEITGNNSVNVRW